MTKFLQLILITFFLISCNIERGNIVVKINRGSQKSLTPTSLASVQLVNNQFVLNGVNLNNVTGVKIQEGSTETHLTIESSTTAEIITNTLSNVTFAAGKVFSFILTDANGASTYTVNFSLCDSTLNGKGFNCLVTPNDK
ncbi:MAG: hypothetical protein K2Q18_17685, partial [Bdellovibrionales bacterium]|nr:hypothetical protein [Bdellovibrionales bacterium]